MSPIHACCFTLCLLDGIRYAIAPADQAATFTSETAPAVVLFRVTGGFSAAIGDDWTAVALNKLVLKSDVPDPLRSKLFHSSWMRNVVLLGAKDLDGEPARKVFDYGANAILVFELTAQTNNLPNSFSRNCFYSVTKLLVLNARK